MVKEGESILIYPTDGADPDMIVAELFKDGLIRVKMGGISKQPVKVSIEAPDLFKIARSEFVTA